MANSKNIQLTDKDTGATYLLDLSEADISFTGNVSIKPKAPPVEEPDPDPPVELRKCPEGPEPKKITNPTQTSLLLLWHGEGVYGWDWWIQKGDKKVAEGKIAPEGNTLTVNYPALDPGGYKFFMQGNTCKSEPVGLDFTIPGKTEEPGPKPPPAPQQGRKFQLIMGTTGSGFQPDAPHGIDPQWVSRIDATKYSWGYGISGICLWVAWDGYERTPGKYEETAFKKAIKFCKDRGLTLSVAFMRRRKKDDGFINNDEIITGSGGSQYFEGVPDFNPHVYAGYANTRVNALSSGAIKSIARLLKTYDKAHYMALAGGGAGEQVNYVWQNNKGIWEAGDHSEDNLRRFDAWRMPRGIDTEPGRPPMIQGAGIDWPHPDYNTKKGLEFGRFTTFGLRVALDSFIDDVKSEAPDIPCLYFYSVTSNRQFRAIQNPNINWIAERADGQYGSDGDGPGDTYAKIKVNSLNLGTFPNKISATELDPDDMSPARNNKGRMPFYGEGGLLYDNFLQIARNLYARGLQDLHLAMAYSEQELKDFEPTLKILNEEWIGKAYYRPTVNDSNTVVVNVTDKYRRSEDLMDGIDAWNFYTRYTDVNFWGGVPPEVNGGGGTTSPPPSKDYSPVKSILEGNAANYNWSYIFDLKSSAGTLYSLQTGQYNKDSRLKVMSHSKFTTGVIISYLIDQGKLSLDTRVGDVIRSWDRPDRAGITIRQIMGHLSGIPDNTDNEGADTLEYYVDELVKKGGFGIPGQTFSYSTTSYQVAARMAEVVTGKSWKQLFEEILVGPCEMGSAEYNPTIGDIKGKPLNPLAGYGLVCSESEWMNFISMIRDGGVFKGRRVLTDKVFAILKTRCSPGWSDWGVGVMFADGQYVSEAASGCFTFILPGKYAGTIFAQSDYERTYGPNHQIRQKVKEIHNQ